MNRSKEQIQIDPKCKHHAKVREKWSKNVGFVIFEMQARK